ncbi:MAG: hypothetical protein AB7E46_03430 [Desulfovibrio sp.]
MIMGWLQVGGWMTADDSPILLKLDIVKGFGWLETGGGAVAAQGLGWMLASRESSPATSAAAMREPEAPPPRSLARLMRERGVAPEGNAAFIIVSRPG